MTRLVSLMLGGALGLFPCLVAAQEGAERPIARPFYDGLDIGVVSAPLDIEWDPLRIPTDQLAAGADHILDQQCADGGFGWPHDDCSLTYHSLSSSIGFGLWAAYTLTADPWHLIGASNAGVFELSAEYDNGEARLGSVTPFFLLRLARATDNTTFSDFATDGLFDPLAAGTYGTDDLDTAGWIASIETIRSGMWVNLRAWDFHTLIPAAAALGQPGQDDLFEQAVLDGLATLDDTDANAVRNDLIGLAGAIRGLVFANRLTFPAIAAPDHSGINGFSTVAELVAFLAAHQNLDGSWYWHSNTVSPTTVDDDLQTTAYAVLALLEADNRVPQRYWDAIQLARNWLISMQLPNGGFPVRPGGSENTEVEAEVLTAVAAVDATIFYDDFESGDTTVWSTSVP